MYLAFLIYLTPRFFHVCMPRSHSRKFCGKSVPCRSNCFHVLSSRCAESCVSRNHSRFAAAEAVPAVVRLMLHPVGQPYSPIFVLSLGQYPTGIRRQSSACPLLQGTPAPTWEKVSISVVGSGCGNPHPGWPTRPQKSSRHPSSHRTGQTHHPSG